MKKTFLTILALIASVGLFSQGAVVKTESHPIKFIEGKIVLNLNINGHEADFILDMGGRTSILPEFAERFGITTIEDTQTAQDRIFYKNIPISKKIKINTIALGNNVFANGLQAFILEGKSAENIRKMGVSGIVSGTIFANSVLTINKKEGKIYASVPYRPSFMSLLERTDCEILPGSTPEFTINIEGKPVKVIFDTWYNGLVSLKEENIFEGSSYGKDRGIVTGAGYEPETLTDKTYVAKDISLIHVSIKNGKVTINPELTRSEVGLELLDYGVLSVDFSKSNIYFQTYDKTLIKEEVKADLIKIEQGKLNSITKEEFIAYIFDYKKGSEFILKGDKPVIIDFWATWCGPCMKLLPVMEKLAEQYKDRVIFYKINADKEKELCSRFNVLALPTLFLVAPGKSPIIEVGDQPEKIISIIENNLLK